MILLQAMNSIEKLSYDLSEFFAVSIELKKSEASTNTYELRFKDLEEGNTFYFKVIRNLSSTSIKLVPDLFGKKSLIILEESILENKVLINNYLEFSKSKISRVDFRIGNNELYSLANKSSDNTAQGVSFEAKIFTEESNLHLGQFSENEIGLLRFTIELYLIFLRVTRTGFIGADEAFGYPEGAVTSVLVNKYERSPTNRKLCLEHYGYSCLGCGFNFAERYGEIGKEFIIVHHVTPVSRLGPDYVIDPKRDLIPLCGNCHAVVHRTNPPLSLENLRLLANKHLDIDVGS